MVCGQMPSKELLKDVVYRQLNVLFSVFINSLFKEVGKAELSVEVSDKQKVVGLLFAAAAAAAAADDDDDDEDDDDDDDIVITRQGLLHA